MATIELKERTASNRGIGIVLFVIVAIAVVVFVVIRNSRPPQMGVDEEAFRTVDALYTAVRNQDEARVAECAQRLHAYRDEGKLPKEAAKFLDEVIAKAKAGQWETATKRLYDFMLAQRREKA